MCSGIMKLDYYGRIFGPDEVKGDPEAVWEMLKAELDAQRAEQGTAEDIQSEDIQTESIAAEETSIP